LRALIEEDFAEGVDPAAPARPADPAGTAAALLDESLQALETLDRARLEKALGDAAVSLSNPHMRRDLIVPLLNMVGDRWRDGTVRVVHEHMATAIVRAFLDGARSPKPASAPKLLATTPAGQMHELGALMAAVVAEEAGWNVVYLGPNTPAEEIAAGARQLGVRAVALSVVYRDDDHLIQEEIRKLRDYLDPDIPIFVGGRAVAALGRSLEADGIHVVRDLADLQDHLARFDR
jgi:methanogenic corrinoid protein MtbC1